MTALGPVGWVAPALGALMALTAIADAALARRYARGEDGADGGTCRHLIVGVQLTLLAGLAAAWTGVGTLPVPHLAAVAGLALAIGGWLLRYTAIAMLGRFFTWRVAILDEHRLIDHGPYRAIRHPSYLGGMLHLAGLALMLANWLGLLAFVIAYLPALARRIAVEERLLLGHFGEQYERYRARTYRLVPFVY